ncbi:MAG TPA: transglycosylase SLT domain-containing protein [Xanthomonadaceae bacterium]|jgi:membrane-bound lytic murein transglycosylase D|nr:transglycosylase SLT domain-containing protein [Xanthomonadaceae bacterium]
MNGIASRCLSATMLVVAVLVQTGCEPVDNARPASADNAPVSEPIPLPTPPPIVVSDLPTEISAPITAPSNAPLPAEGDTLTSGQVLDRLRARLSTPTCIVGPNNTRWRHKYAGYPQHFADEVQATLPMMLVVLDELETHRLPGEFALIPIVESWYRPDTYSFGGASGMWQILSETARNNGATVTGGYDGRLSALDSTDAALNYLGKLHAMFNDWRLTAMAYNSGEYRLMHTMSPEELAARSVGGVHYRRPNGLSWTTYEYVSKMRALTCLLAQPQRQGIPFDPSVPITHWIPYTMPADIDSLDELARRLGTDAEELKAFNHGYRNGRVSADAPRTLLVPASTRQRWASAGTPAPRMQATMPSTANAMPASATPTAVLAPLTPGMSSVDSTRKTFVVPAAINTSGASTSPPPAATVSTIPASTPSAGAAKTTIAAPAVINTPSFATNQPPSAATGGSFLGMTTAAPTAPIAIGKSNATTSQFPAASGSTLPSMSTAVSTIPKSTATITSSPVVPSSTSTMPATPTIPDTHAPSAKPASVATVSTAMTSTANAPPTQPPVAVGTGMISAKPSAATTTAISPPASPAAANDAASDLHSLPSFVSPAATSAKPASGPAATAPTSAAGAPAPASAQSAVSRSNTASATLSATTTTTGTPSGSPAAADTAADHHPLPGVVPQTPIPTTSLPGSATKAPVPASAPTPVASTVTKAAESNPQPSAPRTYKVDFDDSLETIAKRFNVSVDDLRAWNHLAPDASLYVDQVLKLEP